MSFVKGLRRWLQRFAGLFGKRQREAEFAVELESHLQFHVEDNLRRGMTPDAARRDALLKLGGLEQTKENYRDRHRMPALETLFQNLRFGVSALLNQRLGWNRHWDEASMRKMIRLLRTEPWYWAGHCGKGVSAATRQS